MSEVVFSIVVTYNSDERRLEESLASLSIQSNIVVIDNSDLNSIGIRINTLCQIYGAYYLYLGGNYGIAKAQNIGIDFARNKGATDVLLMDDDSLASNSLVSDLISERKLSHSRLVVVSGRTLSVDGRDTSNKAPNSSIGLTECSELTSSGTLIPMTVFDMVGPFNEHLFIDCVDFEWGWRAKALGVSLLLCDRIYIIHRLGNGSRFGLKIPSPIRHYYQYRNILKMIFQSRAPLRWRLIQIFKLPLKLLLLLLLTEDRLIRLRFSIFGIRDFIIGRTGKF